MSDDDREARPDDARERDDKEKIHTEEVKQRYTSHWDWDYLPTEELDAAIEEASRDRNDDERSEPPRSGDG